MENQEGKTYLISFGGSLLMDDSMTFDIEFIKKFKVLLDERIALGDKFVLIVGGGKTARYYQTAGRELGFDQETLDWIGIKSTYLNADLVRLAFGAEDEVYHSPIELPENLEKSLYIVSGWKPGWSTDFVMVKAAEHLNAKTLINLSNTDYIYTADPNKDPEAKVLKFLTWASYKEQMGITEWTPGINVPFDPIASKLAEEIKANLHYLNGKNVENFAKFLKGEEHVASVITA